MERELKIRLPSREDYERVERVLGEPLRRHHQVNTYLDTPGRELHGRRIMVRIRQQEGRLRMAVKWGAERLDGYFVAEEREADLHDRAVEEAVRNGEAARMLARLCPETRVIPLARLEILGSIRNDRLVFRREGFELELDHSTYGEGIEDFELELETERHEEARRTVERLLERAGAKGEDQTLSKYERFLKCAAEERSGFQ